MKIIMNVTLLILVLLAVSSGVAKTMLMPTDVEFFNRFGFSDSVLVAFGISQLIGGILLVPLKFRLAGAVIVSITFLISLLLLILAGDFVVATITFVCIVLLAVVMRNCWNANTN